MMTSWHFDCLRLFLMFVACRLQDKSWKDQIQFNDVILSEGQDALRGLARSASKPLEWERPLSEDTNADLLLS